MLYYHYSDSEDRSNLFARLIIDLFGIYGEEFKQLCDENFIGVFIKLIQEYNKKNKIDPDIEQNIDILKSYYINKN